MRESLLKKMRLVPVAVALLVTVIVSWNVWASKERTALVFSTGSEVGLYHRLAEQMKRVIETHHPDIVIELKESAGSNENIRRLDSGQAELALVQNDAIGGSSVRSVASLYPEVLHLLCRNDAEINSLEDLSGHRIGVGHTEVEPSRSRHACCSLSESNHVRNHSGVGRSPKRSGG